MKKIWMLGLVLVVGCAESEEASDTTVGGESGSDVLLPLEEADTSDEEAECEELAFLCVDAGSFEGESSFEESDTSESADEDEKGEGKEEAGGVTSEEAFAQCISDCVAKGETEEACGPICEAYLSGAGGGDKGDEEAEEKGGETEIVGLEQCVEDCVAKGETEEACLPICEEYVGAGEGGDKEESPEDETSDSEEAEESVENLELDQCIEDCVAKGESEDTCQSACEAITGGEGK